MVVRGEVRRDEKGAIREEALFEGAVSSDLWRLRGGVGRSVRSSVGRLRESDG